MLQKLTSYQLNGELKVAEGCFGLERIGMRNQNAARKGIVIGLPQRNGKVNMAIIPKTEILLLFIEECVDCNNMVCADNFKALGITRFKHQNVSHIQFISNTDNQINGIDFFFHQSVLVSCWYSFISTLS